MDNNELDKILKEKLKDSIKPTKEFEDKMKEKIIENKKAKTEPAPNGEKKPKQNRHQMAKNCKNHFNCCYACDNFYFWNNLYK